MLDSLAAVVPAGLLIGVAAGFLMHRSDFCLVAAFRDPFLFRNTYMLRVLVLLVVASMVLFEALRRLGVLSFYPFPLLGAPSLANVAGGALFGFGMVLAGGCVVGTLWKMGAGGVASAVAFLGLLAGSALYAAVHPAWSRLAAAASFSRGAATVPRLLGVDPGPVVLAVAVPAAVAILRWRSRGRFTRLPRARGYVAPWAAALGLALLGSASYVAVGMPIGVTTSYAKMAASVDAALFGGGLAGTAYFRTVPLDAVNPLTGAVLRGGPGPVFDAIAAIQVPVIAGVVLGGFISALSVGEFAVRGRVPAAQMLLALCGGVVMGLASRMAPGCNVWHLMGGLPLLALPSLLFTAGLLPGAWLGARALGRILS